MKNESNQKPKKKTKPKQPTKIKQTNEKRKYQGNKTTREKQKKLQKRNRNN